MTVVKKNLIRKVKDISVGSALFMSILVGMGSCGDNRGAEGSYDTEEVYTKGVKTYIKEVSKGEFKITDEVEVPVDSSAAIVSYLDGKTETINPKLAKELIDKDYHDNQYYGHHRSGLSSVLLYGGMGYLFGRMGGGNNSYYNYRQQYQNNNPNGGAGVYANPQAYQKSQTVQRNVASSRISTNRPSRSKSGFFSRSSRGGFGG